MTSDILHDRERGIEAQWARQHDQELLQRLRERARLDDVAAALARKLRVDDPELRRRILDLGVTHETGPALYLVPMVQVAWADGHVTERERETILGLAAARGVAAGSPVRAKVLEWLREPPVQELYDAALEVLKVGISVLPDAERMQRIESYAESFRRVAEASHGRFVNLFGLRRAVSREEKRVIARLVETLRG